MMIQRPRFVAVVVSLPFALSLACSSSTTSSTTGARPTGRDGEPGSYRAEPPMTIDAAKTYAATLVTSKGTIEVSLNPKAAPHTVNNFVFLAREKYYDGLTFHRVEDDFVIQGG